MRLTERYCVVLQTLAQPPALVVIVSSPKNNGYVQCEYARTYIRCPFPIWVRLAPHVGDVAPVESQLSPFPDVSSAVPTVYMAETKVLKLRQSLARVGLQPTKVYSRMVDRSKKVVGTGLDMVVVLNLQFDQFDRFVKAVLSDVWATELKDGYRFKVGQWD